MKHLKLIAPLAFLLLSACSKNIQTDEAVKQGIINHLSKNTGLQLASMDVTVSGVTFKDNTAEATVSFKPKGADASAGMQMHYSLERQGTEWVVKKKADSGHGAAMPGMAPAPNMPSLPPSGAAGEMPPNHPPMGAGKTPEKK
ncbi:hypothetical protein [uncultured Paludibaculum sp.]|uniref:hypothetical protein n=1 Tax=uncultured Paludibaculum sp. TaxID=1765020 RepID=UPI002AAAE2A1|nr:hypothetical protein [uncultured Paludibaculum sp.]